MRGCKRDNSIAFSNENKVGGHEQSVGQVCGYGCECLIKCGFRYSVAEDTYPERAGRRFNGARCER